MYSWPFTFVIVTALFFVCLFVLFFFNKYTWDSSRRWCTPGCQSFLVCQLGVVEGVSVFLATYVFCSFLHLPERVARAGVPLAVHPFF